MKNDMAYQVRVSAEETPEDVVTALTHAVWAALQQVKSLKKADPHRWPDLHRDFSRVFKGRVLFYKDCGSLPECRYSIGMYSDKPGGESPAGPTYILTLRGGLLRFVEGLSALVCRRFRESPRREKTAQRKAKGLIQDSLHRALTPYLYYNEGCVDCPARSGRAEKRVWNPRRDPPWKG